MSLSGALHAHLVFPRRVRRLAELLSELIPQYSTVLDVGCGDGLIAKLIAERRTDVSVHGIDILVRSNTHIPVSAFDGRIIPFPDDSFDVVMLVDVIHHVAEGQLILREAARVARQRVLVKDHNCNGLLAQPTLRFMDWTGNAHHGVALPYNYWSRDEWRQAFPGAALVPGKYREDLGLYPWPASLLFERSLHFLVELTPLRVPAPSVDTGAPTA
jgi:SAM-dependent methyltransferase